MTIVQLMYAKQIYIKLNKKKKKNTVAVGIDENVFLLIINFKIYE